MNADKLNSSFDSSVELLTSILLKYPVINTVDINLEKKELKMSFLVNELITDDSWLEKRKFLYRNFKLFKKLQNQQKGSLKIIKEDYKQLVRINFIRDLVALSHKEINFMIKKIKDVFKDKLLQDKEEYFSKTKNPINKLLDDVKNAKFKESYQYLAFREEGKILVFDKSNIAG